MRKSRGDKTGKSAKDGHSRTQQKSPPSGRKGTKGKAGPAVSGRASLLVAAAVLIVGVLYMRYLNEADGAADVAPAAAPAGKDSADPDLATDELPIAVLTTKEKIAKATARVEQLQAALRARHDDDPGYDTGSESETDATIEENQRPQQKISITSPPAGFQTNLSALPAGWEILKSETNLTYFVDHNTGTTTYTDPRLKDETKLRLEKAVWRSAMEGKVDLIEKAIALQPKVGFNLNAVTARGLTALMFAAKEGHDAVVMLLLNAGVAVNLKDMHGHTALDWAVSGEHAAVVVSLLEKGAIAAGHSSSRHAAEMETGNAEVPDTAVDGQATYKAGPRVGMS
jgi:hypothetical protein